MFRWALLAEFTEQDGYFSGFALEDLGTFKVTTENSDEDTGSEDLGIAIAKVGLNEDHQPNSFMSNSDNEWN